MDKAWLEQKTKECESVRPEIEKILRNKLHLDDKEFEKLMKNIKNYQNLQELKSCFINTPRKIGLLYIQMESQWNLMEILLSQILVIS